jgi:hypothetical protein
VVFGCGVHESLILVAKARGLGLPELRDTSRIESTRRHER